MKRAVSYLGILFIALWTTCSTPETDKEEVLLFAAASMTDVINEMIDSYPDTSRTINVNYASSGTLAQQILNGGEPDIFISANKLWAEEINKNLTDKIISDTVLCMNALCVIVPTESGLDTFALDSLLAVEGLRIGIGDTAHVPAGRYAWKALSGMDLADTLQPYLIPQKDVRSVLMVTEMNEVDVGFVYVTDAMLSEKVKILYTLPEEYYGLAEYYALLLNDSEKASEFYGYLQKEGRPMLKKFGFILDEKE